MCTAFPLPLDGVSLQYADCRMAAVAQIRQAGEILMEHLQQSKAAESVFKEREEEVGRQCLIRLGA